MKDDGCPCCQSATESTSGHDRSTGHWLGTTSVLDTELPRDVQSALGRFLGTEPVETLGVWADEVRRRTGDGSISIEELCVTDEETVHRGIVDGYRYDFACFYDAVILAALSDEPVDIRTKSPNDEVIEALAVGSTELTVTPDGAVFSFGIEHDVEPPADDGPTLEHGYASICPYVKAFPDSDAYERWAKRTPAATVAMPLAGATELAEALVKDPPT